MKKYMNTYNETLEAAGMLSPRKAAAILAALPEEMLTQIGVIKPHEPRKKQCTDNAGNDKENATGAGTDAAQRERI